MPLGHFSEEPPFILPILIDLLGIFCYKLSWNNTAGRDHFAVCS